MEHLQDQTIYTLTTDIRYSRSKRIVFLVVQGTRIVNVNEIVAKSLSTDYKPDQLGLLVKEHELTRLRHRIGKGITFKELSK